MFKVRQQLGAAALLATLEVPDDVIRLTVAFLRRHAQGPAAGS